MKDIFIEFLIFFKINSITISSIFIGCSFGIFILFFLVKKIYNKMILSKSPNLKSYLPYLLITSAPYSSLALYLKIWEQYLNHNNLILSLLQFFQILFLGFAVLSTLYEAIKIIFYVKADQVKSKFTNTLLKQLSNEKIQKQIKALGFFVITSIILFSLKQNLPQSITHSISAQLILLLDIIIIGILGILIFTNITHFMAQMLQRNEKSTPYLIIFKSINWPLRFTFLAIILFISQKLFNFTESIIQYLQLTTQIILILAGIWFVYNIIQIIGLKAVEYSEKENTPFEKTFVEMIHMILRVSILVLGAIFIFQTISGKSMTTVLTGLGIGGLAVALAAQDTLKNFFGSFMLVMDKPFKVGETVVFGDVQGSIESVGMRSTKIRTFSGNLITVPNDKMASSSIENIGRRPSIRRIADIAITYNTSAAKVQEGIDIIKNILNKRKENLDSGSPFRVHFTDFNASSLNIKIVYWFSPPNYWEFQDFNETVNLEIFKAFEKAGIEFAYPTQTTYLHQVNPLELKIIDSEKNLRENK